MANGKLSNYIKGAITKASPAAKKTSDYIDVDFVDELQKNNKKALGALGAGAALGAGGGYFALDDETQKEAEGFLKKEEPVPTEPDKKEPPATGGRGSIAAMKTGPTTPPDDTFEASRVKFKSVVADPIDQAEEYDLLDADYKTALGKAQDAYEKTKDRDASKALWEGIVQGIGHLAAGVHGMRTGLNLGGMKFDKTDWEAKQKNNMLELQQAIDSAKDVRGVKGAKLDRSYQRSLDKLKQNEQLNDRALNVAINNARLEDAAKERKQRQAIENQRARVDLIQKALSGKDSATVAKIKELEKLEKRLFDLNKAYGKEEAESILDLLKTETQRYKQLSGALGMPADAYEPSDFKEEKGWLWGTNKPSVESIEERRRGRLGGAMVNVTVNGQAGQIPRSQLDAFLKKYPDATVEE